MTDGSGFSLEQDDQSSDLISNLPLILWHRKWLVILPALLIASAAAAAAFLLPRSYQSRAVLLVEAQSLPGGMATAPLSDVIDRRMAKIRQQILSRPDLVELIQTNNLYNASSRSEPLSRLVDRMRDATNISAVDADISGTGQAGAGSIAFSLSFDYPAAAQAQLVAQTFVNRLLKLDASATQETAVGNVRFLEDQEAGLQTQLSALESQINQITGQNGAALANSGAFGSITIGGDYQGQIATLRRENAQLAAQNGGTAVGRDPAVVAAEAQLAAVRAQYSDDHPDVKLAQSRLAAARANASAFQANTVSSVVQQQIDANNASIAELSRAQSIAQGRAATMAAAQARGPAVAQQVSQLQAKADSVRTDLGKINTNLMDARSMAKLTEEQRGERLTLIDPPVVPDMPSKPNRPLLIAGGILGGLGAGVVLAFLIELIHRPIRSVNTLTKLVGAPPLGVVPTLSKKMKRRRKRSIKTPRVAINEDGEA